MARANVKKTTETVTPVEVKKETVEKKKFAPDEEVTCRAILVGITHILGKRTGSLYTFLGKDDTIGIEYRDLVAEVREGSKSIFKPMIIVEDEDFVNEFPKLKTFYKNMYSPNEMKNILKKSANEIKALLPTLPPGIQSSLKGMAADMVRSGELDSVSVIKALDEVWGTQLNILTGLFDAE